MKKYTVLIHFVIGTEVVSIRYHDVETITYYSSNGKITITNDRMLTDEIPLGLGTNLYMQGKDNNASVNSLKIISVQISEEN